MSGIPMGDKGWTENDYDLSQTNFVHVYPLNDLRAHVTQGIECWCKPSIDGDDEVIIHNAMDGRELWELGRKLS